MTDRDAAFAAVRRAHEHFGRLDVVVNNAGYGQFGMVEELSEADARDQIETNLFGALWVTQAALPFLREQGSGHILQVSSIGGISAFPRIGIYHASKWGARGDQPGAGAGGRAASASRSRSSSRAASRPTGAARRPSTPSRSTPTTPRTRPRGSAAPASHAGDPTASAAAVMRDRRRRRAAAARFFGTAPLGIAERDYEGRLATWREWQPVAELAQGG